MNSRPPRARYLTMGLLACILGLPAGSLRGEERSQEFLEGLRERQLYDVALDYLQQVRASTKVSQTFWESIDLEEGVTLIESAQFAPLTEREKLFDRAEGLLKKFITERPLHPRNAAARHSLGNLLLERGRMRVGQADMPGNTPEQKKQLMAEARTLFDEASKSLTTLNSQLIEKYRAFKFVDKKDTAKLAEQKRIQNDIIDSGVTLARLTYEIAQTYEPGSKEAKQSLTAAATQYGAMYDKYADYLGGLIARIGEARCYYELGQYPKVSETLEDPLNRTDDTEGFLRMRGRATALAMQTALMPDVKQYQQAFNYCRAWDAAMRPRSKNSEETLVIKSLGGEAALELARTLSADDPKEAKTRREYLAVAREWLRAAARRPNSFQQRAQVKLTDALFVGEGAKESPPKSFDEACGRAKIAWDQMQEPDLKPDELLRIQEESLLNFRFALSHPPPDIRIGELKTIRYCLAYLYWITNDHYGAAVLGEFMARTYPDSPEGQQGAKIALASYAKLSSEAATREDQKFHNRHMENIARHATERWPGSAGADEAWMVLVRSAVADRQLKKAVEYLNEVPADSPRRGEAELAAGQALWAAYLDALRLSDEERPAKADMNRMLVEAKKALEGGIRRLRKPVDDGGKVDYNLAAAVLSLAQIYLDVGQAGQAVRWIDDPKIGPHTLLNDPVTDRGNFRVETIKATLRAYVAARNLEAAEKAMDALEKASGNANLTRIYISLGRQLEDSLKRIRAEGKKDEAAEVARGFELFLSRLSSRPAAETTFNSLSWVAETFMSLGGSLESGRDGALSPEAEGFYRKAADAYRRILELCRADDKFSPQPGAEIGVQVRLARCLRYLGRFDEALDTLVEILKVRNTLVDAQREAATTYEAWGAVKAGYYLLAIKGGHKVEQKDGTVTYLVWGWADLARRVQANADYESLFHEARYHLALCRYKLALSKNGQERSDLLKHAETDITLVFQLDPEMGGRAWYDQYDALLRKIQKLRGEKKDQEMGLKGAAAAAAENKRSSSR